MNPVSLVMSINVSLPGKVNSFLCELSLAMFRVFARLVFHHLNPFTLLALFMTVFGNHIKLADSVLQKGRWTIKITSIKK